MFDPTKPYNELPHLPPRAEVESKAILKACITARAQLARLDQAAGLFPNSSALINTIPILEAQASSEIENIVTTSDELFRQAELNEADMNPAAKEALRYRTALRQGFENLKSRPLVTRTAIDVCRTIKGIDLDIRKTPGVALKNTVTKKTIYTPPEGEERIRELLSNWEKYLHADDGVDPLIKMAVQHYQFEAIHPFPDGNGRTGRVLNVLFLVERKLLSQPLLYLSRFILENRNTYYQSLNLVTETGNWEDWIQWMLGGVSLTCEKTNLRIQCIRLLLIACEAHLRKAAPKIYSRDLLDVIFSQPYCRINDLVDAQIAKRQTASVYLQQLCDIGVLERISQGRHVLFLNRRFLETLTSDPVDCDLFELSPHDQSRRVRLHEMLPLTA